MHIGYVYYKCIFTNPDNNNSSNCEEMVENVFPIILYIYNFIFLLLIPVVPILLYRKDALYIINNKSHTIV